MPYELIGMDYETSRIAFFEEQKRIHEKKLDWWEKQKPNKRHSAITIYEMCSYHGEAVCYLDDAINALRKEERA